MTIIIQVFVGLVSTMLLGLLVKPLVDHVKRIAPPKPPTENMEDKWKVLTGDPNLAKRGSWLGFLERLLFFGAVWSKAYVIIGGWLAFKVVSKWEVWSRIISVPGRLDDVDDLDYLIARHQWGSQRLMSFLVGTIANILVAFAGMSIGRYGFQFIRGLCDCLE